MTDQTGLILADCYSFLLTRFAELKQANLNASPDALTPGGMGMELVCNLSSDCSTF